MNKKALISAGVTIVVAALIAWYFATKTGTGEKPASSPPATSSESAAVQRAAQAAVPSFGDVTSPLQNQPNVNPAENANPLQSVKTNPFQ